MKFVLLVEGETEQAGLSRFLGRALAPSFDLAARVGFKPAIYSGWSDLYEDAPKRTYNELFGKDASEIIAVISIIDLYGPTFYPDDKRSIVDRVDWGREHMESRVRDWFRESGQHEPADKYRHFFAVHETEAWFLAQPGLFGKNIRNSIASKTLPEAVNFKTPPSKFLDGLYMHQPDKRKHYGKVSSGYRFFEHLDPTIVADKCPYFRAMVHELRGLAADAGVPMRGR